jgi:pantothenate kinase
VADLSVEEALARAAGLAATGRRTLLGLTGPPGGGKSTLAGMIAAHVGADAQVVGMDGFHLAQVELARLGREDRKGAVDTFDVGGFVALLRRLRAAEEEVVYAPLFRRDLEEPIGSAVPVPRTVPLVVTEGNYLLVADGGWAGVREALDEVWFVDVPEELRLRRLIERHVAFGRSPEAARAWAMGTDQRNAELIEATRDRADAVVRL